MRRYFFESWEELNYLLDLRWKYIRIKRRYLFQKANRYNTSTVRKASIWFFVFTIIIIVILIGYKFPAFGFSDYTSPSGEYQRGKTVWDWIQLLAMPVIISLLAYYLTSAQKDKELAVAQIEKSEEALQNYLDYMTKLLVEQDYSDEEKFEGAARLMRARTLTVLELLSGKQKGHLLRFLIETELLNEEQTYLNMKKANLTGLELDPGSYGSFNLNGVNLDGANLEWCHFQDVMMNGISMRNANLENASFESASLEYVLLNKSDLYNARLSKAKLYKADLRDANLEGADLREAILSRSNLRGASLRESIAIKISLDSCDLSFANLRDADLEEADMSQVNFYRTNLKNTNLKNANLTDSNITESQLRKAKSFQGAKLPSNIRMNKLK